MSKTETIISRNIHFWAVLDDIKDFLMSYEDAIKNNISNKAQTDFYNEHFGNTNITQRVADLASKLHTIMVDPETRKTFKTRKQIKLTPEETKLIYDVFDFVSNLKSIKFRYTELEDIHYWFQESYELNRFYDVVGMVEQFIETYDVVNCETMLNYGQYD